jgi:hypothetical protein
MIHQTSSKTNSSGSVPFPITATEPLPLHFLTEQKKESIHAVRKIAAFIVQD